jgi:hypothetical protein
LKKRSQENKNDEGKIKSVYVFPGGGKTGHLIEPKLQIREVIKKSGVQFMSHDLRRTFLSVAESLDVSHYALKRLVNHHNSSDVTGGYIINDVERLHEPIQQIASSIMKKTGLKLATTSNGKILKLPLVRGHSVV